MKVERSGPTLRCIADEAAAAALATKLLTAARTGLVLLGAFTLALGIITVTSNAAKDAARQVSAGRNTLRIVGASNSAVTASSCDAVNAEPGVRAAGGFKTVGDQALANVSGLPAFAVTPGFARFLSSSAPSASTARVIVGHAAAVTAGVKTRSIIDLDGKPTPVVVMPPTPRTRDWSGSLLVVTPPTGFVSECWVEFDDRPRVSESALVLIDAPRPLAIGPIDRSTLAPTSAEVTRLAYSPTRCGVALGLVIAVVTILLWWARRADWALYLMLGFDLGDITALALFEKVWCVLVPALIGTTFGILVGLRGAPAPIAPVLRASSIAVLISLQSLSWLRIYLMRASPRRLLAGL